MIINLTLVNYGAAHSLILDFCLFLMTLWTCQCERNYVMNLINVIHVAEKLFQNFNEILFNLFKSKCLLVFVLHEKIVKLWRKLRREKHFFNCT